jgi:CheY-like chemotaxis protein
VKLSFEDDGVGIPAEIIDKIFDPYFSTKPSGSGLGLAITHSVIAKHGGHITAVSEPGVGTRIEIHLPALKHAEVAAKPVLPTPVVRENGRMLVMDDDVLLRRVVREMGLSMGLEVLVAGDGVEAIRLYAESLAHDQPIDLVIMDLTVPGGMGGEAAIKEILALDQNAKVVVSSGYSNDPVMANFRNYGFKAAIVKPFDLDAITRVVSELLAAPPS